MTFIIVIIFCLFFSCTINGFRFYVAARVLINSVRSIEAPSPPARGSGERGAPVEIVFGAF